MAKAGMYLFYMVRRVCKWYGGLLSLRLDEF